ncbi:hypothetical protein ACFQDG_10625 [Natronoarchaeum mannanilyticum]
MNRRNVLAGIGALTAGGGAVFGSGAFSQVEAERTVDISTTGDSGALLQFSGSSTLVNLDGGNDSDLLKISASNLNKDATTTAKDAITVTNTGDNAVGFYVDDESSQVSGVDEIDIQVDGTSIVGSSNSVDLNASNGSADLDLVFDLTGDNIADDIPGSITFVADTSSHSGA